MSSDARASAPPDLAAEVERARKALHRAVQRLASAGAYVIDPMQEYHIQDYHKSVADFETAIRADALAAPRATGTEDGPHE